MEQINIKYEEYNFYEIISDICALLNSNGGKICIYGSLDINNRADNEKKIRELLKSSFYTINIGDSYFEKDVICLTEYVSFYYEHHKKEAITQIEVLSFFNTVGKIVIFNHDEYLYYFYKGKKIKIVAYSIYNRPFVFQLLQHGPNSPHSYELPLYELFSYTLGLHDIKKSNKVFTRWLDGLNHIEYFYKYMSYDSALLCLNNNNICFSQPSNWEDQYEKRFYEASYFRKDTSNAIKMPKLYACCFTSKQENEAAWKIYSHNSSDTGSKVVEFKLNFRKLIEQLVIHISDCVLYVGLVKYRDKRIIDNLHKRKIIINEMFINAKESDNPYYYYYFDDFSKDCFLELMLLKRDAFEHEQEIRLFIVPNSEDFSGKIQLVNINWIDIIEQIRISDNCTIKEKNELQKILNQLLEKKKHEFNLGFKKCIENGENYIDYLSNTFVHSDWDNGREDNNKNFFEKIDEYFTNLKLKIELVDFNVYSSDNSNLDIIIE